MYKNQKIVVVMPAYNAAQTIRKTYEEVIAQEIVDLVIVVDDDSSDATVSVAEPLPNTLVQGVFGSQVNISAYPPERNRPHIILQPHYNRSNWFELH